MATTTDKFDSLTGFSVDKTVVVDELRNVKDVNTFEIKNRNFADGKVSNYILRGVGTGTLQLDTIGTQVPIDSNTINFITGRIIGVNPQTDVYSAKFETVLSSDASGNTTLLSTMITVIKDDVPNGQTWDIQPLGSQNKFSYTTTITGTTNVIKWAVSTEVHSIEWQ
jgi:hypothetical protein